MADAAKGKAKAKAARGSKSGARPQPVPLEDLKDTADILEIWVAQSSFQAAIVGKTSGFAYQVPVGEPAKDRADTLLEMAEEVKGVKRIEALSISDVVNKAKLCHNDLQSYLAKVEGWKPPSVAAERIAQLEALFTEYDAAMVALESYIEAVDAMRVEFLHKSKDSDAKRKKRVKGCLERFFQMLRTNNVPRFIAKVTTLTSHYLYFCL